MSEVEPKLQEEAEDQEQPKKRRGGRKKNYFAEEQERAFREFLVCENKIKKDKIFGEKVYPALCKLTECLIRRYYLFTVDETYEETFYGALSFLITKIHNFDPDKKCKAYSYCGTVCKNYLLAQRMKSMKKRDRFLSYEVTYPSSDSDGRVNEEVKDNTALKLINKAKDEIKEILKRGYVEERQLTSNEVKVGNALIEVLEHWDEMLDDSSSRKFNKLSILYFIKEYTLCTTTQVRTAMRVFKNAYLLVKESLLNEE